MASTAWECAPMNQAAGLCVVITETASFSRPKVFCTFWENYKKIGKVIYWKILNTTSLKVRKISMKVLFWTV